MRCGVYNTAFVRSIVVLYYRPRLFRMSIDARGEEVRVVYYVVDELKEEKYRVIRTSTIEYTFRKAFVASPRVCLCVCVCRETVHMEGDACAVYYIIRPTKANGRTATTKSKTAGGKNSWTTRL